MSIQTDALRYGKWIIQQTLGWAANKVLEEIWQQLTTPPPQHFRLIASMGIAADHLAYLHAPNGWYYWNQQSRRLEWATYLPVGFVPSYNFYSDSQGKLYWLRIG